MAGSSLSVGQVKHDLIRLRQGQALAHPTAIPQALSTPVRDHLTRDSVAGGGSVDEVTYLDAVVRAAIAEVGDDERPYLEADFNLAPDHRFPTLTERQESLASLKRCASKTVRRRSARALDTLAYLLLADRPSAVDVSVNSVKPVAERTDRDVDALRQFWRLSQNARIDIVCSEIPRDERPEYASPSDRNYLRYAKFADLDSLMYLRTRFAQLEPRITVRDFAPSEYYDTQADTLVVVGGPPWNTTYREFLPQLPFYFEPNPLGEDDPIVVPALGGLTVGPRWTAQQDLLEDLAVFTRLTLTQGTTVFLLGGCLTLGVLGAARCLLDADRGASNIDHVLGHVGDDDFVLVMETRRVGGLTDVADLDSTSPLLLLARSKRDPFEVVVDNTDRYIADAVAQRAR